MRMDKAREEAAIRNSDLTMRSGGQSWPILRLWDKGFALASSNLPTLRGFVDIHEGDAHLCQALIVASELVGQEVHCTFKRMTAIRDTAPLDFEAQQTPARLRLTHQKA